MALNVIHGAAMVWSLSQQTASVSSSLNGLMLTLNGHWPANFAVTASGNRLSCPAHLVEAHVRASLVSVLVSTLTTCAIIFKERLSSSSPKCCLKCRLSNL